MKINELVGIKNTSFVAALPKKVTDFDSKSNNLSDAVNELISNGWKVLGQGHSAYALEKEGLPYVLRLSYNDLGYQKFLKFVKANANNPHMPKVKGLGATIGKGIFAIRIEKLQKLTYKDPVLRHYISPDLDATFDMLDSEDNQEFLKQNHPEFFQVLNSLNHIDPNNDINVTNIMKRGNTLVITDPFM